MVTVFTTSPSTVVKLNFNFKCPDLRERNLLFCRKLRFYSEGDPIPLPNSANLTGTEIYLEQPYDEETGDVYFTLYTFEHGNLTKLRMKFLKKKGKTYRIVVDATVPPGVFRRSRKLRIETWIKQLPSGKYGGG